MKSFFGGKGGREGFSSYFVKLLDCLLPHWTFECKVPSGFVVCTKMMG